VGPRAPQILPGFAYDIDSIVRTVWCNTTFDPMAILIDFTFLKFQIVLSINLFPGNPSLNQTAGWLSFVSVCPTGDRFKNLSCTTVGHTTLSSIKT
jgi:hypothetical protein